MPTVARTLSTLSTLLLAGFAAAAAAHDDDRWWSRSDDVGRKPVTQTINEKYDFSATGRVTAYDIGGSVEVKVGASNAVAFTYERRAASQRDLECETLRHSNAQGELRIWSEHKRGKDCQVIRADDKLTVTVPRGASVEVRDIGDEVTVTGVEGLVRISDVGNRVTLTGAQQVDARDIGNSVELTVTQLGAGGIRISDIGNSVELNLPEKLDARMHIASVGNKISGPGLRLKSDDDYQAVVGAGGPMIRVEDIGNSVVIRGPRLSQPEREDRRNRDHNYY